MNIIDEVSDIMGEGKLFPTPSFSYEEPSVIESLDYLKNANTLFKALQEDDLNKAKKIFSEMDEDTISFFKEYMNLRNGDESKEYELALKGFEEITKEAKNNIIYQVKLALDETDQLKDHIRMLMHNADKEFSEGRAPEGIVLLSQVYPVAEQLNKDVLTREFQSFIEDDGMKEWIQEFADERKTDFDSFDVQAISMIIREVSALVYQNRIFKGEKVIEVEE